MKYILCLALIIGANDDTFSQKAKTSSDRQYAFIMVINKAGPTLHFSPIFSFKVDKRGNPVCALSALEVAYRKKVADEEFDVMSSDYFDTEEEANTARTEYMDSEKKAGRTVFDSTEKVGTCD